MSKSDPGIPVRFAVLAGVALAMTAAAAAAAPARRALPDWSGVWSPVEGNMFDPTAGRSVGGEGPGPQSFREFPPYNAEWEAKYKKEIDLAMAGQPRDPTAACVPPGMPRLMTSPYPWEFVVLPDRVLILKEYQSQVRRVYTDGRKHPADPDPSYNGHSIGHWEGDTLVIDTVGMRGDTWYDRTGAPHSDKVHLVERMRKTSPNEIELVMTIEDPVAFTKPWVVTRHYKREPTWEIMEFVCTENNRNVLDANGVNTVVLAGPK
jgi:hypothetical protein